MSAWLDTLIVVAIFLGGPAYIVATGLVVTLRIWLGHDGPGWLKGIINTAITLLGLLTLLYLNTLFNFALPPSPLRRDLTRSGFTIALSAAPYVVIVGLLPWVLGRRNQPPPTAALTPTVLPPEEER